MIEAVNGFPESDVYSVDTRIVPTFTGATHVFEKGDQPGPSLW